LITIIGDRDDDGDDHRHHDEETFMNMIT